MATYYWIGGTGTWNGSNVTNWSLTSGGLPGVAVPTSTDTVIFDSASGTGTCTTASGSACATATLNSSSLGLTLGANHTMSGTFTLTLGALSLGSNTLTCNSFSSSNSNTRSIAFGTGNITLTGNNTVIWSMSTSTGFTYTGTPTVNATYSGSVGTRSISTSGIVESNAVDINVTAGTDSVSISSFRNINLTGFSGTLNNSTRNIFGNLTLSSGVTVNSGTNATTFAATSGTQQITTNGKTLDFPLTFNGVGGTFQLQDNCTVGSTRTVTLTNGTLDLNSKTLSCGLFSSNNSNTRSIAFGTGNITLTGSATSIVAMATATGFTATGNRVVNATANASTGTRTISLGTVAETSALSINVTAGTDSLALSGSMNSVDLTGFSGTLQGNLRTIYGNFTLSSTLTSTGGSNATTFAATSGTKTITTNGTTVGCLLIFNGVGGTWECADALNCITTVTLTNGILKLKSGTTSTVVAFATSGTTQKYLQSTTPGSRATLSQSSGTVNVSYLTIKDNAATGGATFNAYRNLSNIDAGNNTGWDFLSTPVTTTTLSMRLGFGL